MSLFQPAQVTTAKLKMALMGFQGSGKTYTATSTAIGLVQMMRDLRLSEGNRPIAFADTEKGSDWILPRIKKAGLEMVSVKTRAFSDLVTLVNEAEKDASVLMVDSLTHFWTELCDTYCSRKAAEFRRPTYRLQFQDWAFLKTEWRKFTDRFVNSNLHILVCGRAGFEYDFIEDDETHKKQLEKTGIKFKAEGEMGYEPDLLVLMERKFNMETKSDEHVAHVVKDRSTLLDGKEFADPTFNHFLPHIKCLNLGGQQLGIDTTRTSAASIPAEAPRDTKRVMRDILVDEINDLLMRHDAAGTSKEAQKKRSELLQRHFDTVSKTAIEESIPFPDLKMGFDCLHQELEGRPSRYSKPAAELSPAQALDLNDSLPDFTAVKIEPSAALLASRIVVEATKPVAPVDTTTVADNGMPAFLDRRTQGAIETPAFDEAKWLADLTKAFEECVDFVSFGQSQLAIMNPAKPKVTAPTWEKAAKLAKRAIKRITEQSTGDFAAAAAE